MSIPLLFFVLGAFACSSIPAEKNTKSYNSAAAPVNFYQKYISPVDGHRCHMKPSCSSYSRQVFERHGLLKGWIMTCDRLIRCGGDEFNVSGTLEINGRLYCNDSVDNNDFWWYREADACDD